VGPSSHPSGKQTLPSRVLTLAVAMAEGIPSMATRVVEYIRRWKLVDLDFLLDETGLEETLDQNTSDMSSIPLKGDLQL